jgi:hypothetical protein
MRTSRRHRKGGIAELYPFSTLRDFDVAKREAAKLVSNALADGSLAKRPCVVCGRRAEAHHDDYSRPLDITWLCRFHHRKRDADLRIARRSMATLPVSYLKSRARVMVAPHGIVKSNGRSFTMRPCTIDLVVRATRAFSALMDTESVSENKLARRMKVSRQVVNQQFAGGFRTLKVIAAYADALGYDVSVEFHKRGSEAVAS